MDSQLKYSALPINSQKAGKTAFNTYLNSIFVKKNKSRQQVLLLRRTAIDIGGIAGIMIEQSFAKQMKTPNPDPRVA